MLTNKIFNASALHLQIPPYETLDTSRAKACRCFILDKDDMEQKLNGSVPASYDIL